MDEMNNPDRILIVEDDEGTRRSLHLILENKGYQVTESSCGEEALRLAQENSFDLGILDIRLPDMRGTDLIQPLKETQPGIILIMATAYASLDTAVQALNQGAAAYIDKPLNMDVVLATLREFLEKKSLAEGKEKAERDLAASEARYRALFEHSLNAVALHEMVTDQRGNPLDFVYLETNQAFDQVSGLEPGALIGKRVSEVLEPNEAARFIELFSQVVLTGESMHLDYHSPERQRYFDVTLFSPQSGQCVTSFFDVTDKKSSEQAIQRQLEELTILQAVSSVSMEAFDEDVLIERVTELLARNIYSDHIGVLLLDKEKGELHLHPSYRGVSNQDLQLRLQLGQGITGQVAASGLPQRVADTRLRSDYVPNVNASLCSEVCVPIRSPEGMIGVINAEAEQVDAFSPADERLLSTIAGLLATAILKTRLFAETRQRLQHMQTLYNIDQLIAASVDIKMTLDILLEQVTTSLGVDAAAALLYQPSTQLLEYTAASGLKLARQRFGSQKLGQGLAGQAALARQIVLQPNLDEPFIFPFEQLDKNQGYHFYCAVPLVAKGELKGVLEIYNQEALNPDDEWLDFLKALSTQAALAIDNQALFDNLQRSNNELVLAYDLTLEGWARALELRDQETEGHCQRVVELTMRLARELHMNEHELVHVRRGAYLHDIGKMGIPDKILQKPGELSEQEWEIMRQHPVYAYNLLAGIPFLRPAMAIPYCHHEKWDGTGYPRQLQGDQIPLAARVFSVVDVYDALRSDRPYRKAWPEPQVIDYIIRQSGQHFDPEIVVAFLKIIDA